MTSIEQLTSAFADFIKQSEQKNAGGKSAKHLRQGEHPHNYKNAPDSGVKAPANSMGQKSGGDSVEISPDGMRKAAETETDSELQKLAGEFNSRMRQLGEMRAQSNDKSWEIRTKCMQIALRIANGDEVPAADHQYLMKHDPELYAQAISKRIPKLDPEKYDRLSEDEESDDVNATDVSEFGEGESQESASVEAQGAPGAGPDGEM